VPAFGTRSMLRSTETKKCCQIISVSSHSKKRKERDPDGGVSSSLISKRERIRPEIRQSSTQESPSSSARAISTLDVQFDSEFYEALKCPICVHFYQPKVFICQNGHSICSNCFENRKRKRCWSCRTLLNGARNHALEKVILDTTFPCQYRKHGCLHRVTFQQKTIGVNLLF